MVIASRLYWLERLCWFSMFLSSYDFCGQFNSAQLSSAELFAIAFCRNYSARLNWSRMVLFCWVQGLQGRYYITMRAYYITTLVLSSAQLSSAQLSAIAFDRKKSARLNRNFFLTATSQSCTFRLDNISTRRPDVV